MAQLARFQKRINEMIPLSEALGICLEAYDGSALLVSAPLQPNHNHQGTGFGGSVYSVAVVSAWGLVELVLGDLGLEGKVVIQVGEIEHLEPVTSDFYALCRLPGGEVPDRFRKSLARHGKARLSLIAEVYCGSPSLTPSAEPAAVFQGRFVVQDIHSKMGN